MKTKDLGGTCVIPVHVLGNGEVYSFRINSDSAVSIKGIRLRRTASGRVLAVFDHAIHADACARFFPGCKRVTYVLPDDAFDLTLDKEDKNGA